MTDELVNLNEDLATILEKKRKYHQDQIAFHQKALQNLSVLTPASKQVSPSTNGKANFDKPWWWEKHIPDIAKRHFPNSEFGNADLVHTVQIAGLEDDDEYKRAVRYAVSMGLSANVKKGFLSSREEIGVRGKIYKLK